MNSQSKDLDFKNSIKNCRSNSRFSNRILKEIRGMLKKKLLTTLVSKSGR